MMGYMCIVIFGGISLFSLVTNEIFNARKTLTIECVTSNIVHETENLLFQVSG